MSSLYFVLIIVGMFIVTFGVRFVLFAKANRVAMPDSLERALKFVPVAVLTAIIAPMIFIQDKEISFAFDNPWLLGALAAFGVGIWRQKQLLTIFFGVMIFFVSKYWLS